MEKNLLNSKTSQSVIIFSTNIKLVRRKYSCSLVGIKECWERIVESHGMFVIELTQSRLLSQLYIVQNLASCMMSTVGD